MNTHSLTGGSCPEQLFAPGRGRHLFVPAARRSLRQIGIETEGLVLPMWQRKPELAQAVDQERAASGENCPGKTPKMWLLVIRAPGKNHLSRTLQIEHL